MLINLFDNTFRHDVCSVAGKVPKYIQYVRDLPNFGGVTFFVDGCAGPETVRSVNSPIKVGWLHEPPCLHPEDYDNVALDDLDWLLTYDERFAAHPKALFAPYGGVWIPRNMWQMPHKTKLCSMLIGDKVATDGHRIRKEVADLVEPMDLVDFYGTRGEPVPYGWETKHRVLRDYAFTIVTETCFVKGLFTEWLLDCFAMGTIPIYWGCPNAGQLFHEEGILAFDTADQARELVQGINMWLYDKLRPHVRDNHALVGDYEITEDWIYQNALKKAGLV
jgi:hypothetical protein